MVHHFSYAERLVPISLRIAVHSGCIRGRVGGGERYQRRRSREATIGSLSTRVFETRTATGSEVISLLTYPHTTTFTLLSIFSPLKISSRKIWGTLWSKHAKCSLPVAVRVLKTRVLKLPKCLTADEHYRVT